MDSKKEMKKKQMKQQAVEVDGQRKMGVMPKKGHLFKK